MSESPTPAAGITQAIPTDATVPESGAPPESPTAAASTRFYADLHKRCGEIIAESLQGTGALRQGRSHSFTAELQAWVGLLLDRPEVYLLRSAAKEWQHGLLALAQGQYAQSFRSLRLVLELALQAVYLSAHPIELREWLENRKDTVWQEIMHAENGLFSPRFANAFAPDLNEHTHHYAALARDIYRECSECVHGNVQKHIALPESFVFSKPAFDLWHDKANTVSLVLSFALCLRYLRELSEEGRASLEVILLDRLGHMREVRQQFGVVGGDT